MALSVRRWCPFAIAVLMTMWCSLVASAGDDRPAAPKIAYFPATSEVEAKIEAALKERTELNFVSTSLVDALSFVKDYHQIKLFIDVAALQHDGIDPSTTVSLEVSGITLRSALRLLLEREELTYVVEDEVLKVTTRTAAVMRQQTRVYPVADLASSPEELQSLVEAVQNGIDAKWRTREDSSIGGTITAVLGTKALVIRQTYAGHEKVLELLNSLRDAQEAANSVK